MLSVLLLAAAIGANAETTWTVNRPLIGIVDGLKARFDQPSEQLPVDLHRLFEVARDVHFQADAHADVCAGYYKFSCSFHIRHLSGSKSLEVWGQCEQTTLRSRISLSWGRDGRVVSWVLRRVEERLLEFEREKLNELTRAP